MVRKESELFGEVKRYQRPISWHTDTYAAVLLADLPQPDAEAPQPDAEVPMAFRAGARVAVKGPFKSEEEARVAQKVQRLKGLVRGALQLPLLEVVVLALEPDLFPDSPNRQVRVLLSMLSQKRRRQWQGFWFHITEDLTAPLELPMRRAEPSANWPQGVDVVDWAALKLQGYHNAIPTVQTYEQSVFGCDGRAARALVTHVLLDWIFGVGGDLAFRAFIYPRYGLVSLESKAWTCVQH